ncbi:MAG: ChbG/HpnK family deacetylase [Acidiferrobacterales bacterium]
MSSQIQVIINADDLGMSRAVNDSIFSLIGQGLVTSATIMANGPQVDQAIARSTSFPGASYGIHLNLTEFHPLSSAKGLAPLLNSEGAFSGSIWQVRPRRRLLQAVSEELGAQIEFLRSNNVAISHIDSHHHIHTLPWMFPVIKYLQVKFAIRRVRISWNVYSEGRQPSRLLATKKRLYNFALRNLVKTLTTEGFSDLPAFIENAKSGRISRRIYEIMVHPGVSSEQDELVASGWHRKFPYSVEMISYWQLG